jgi:hypothetical protein
MASGPSKSAASRVERYLCLRRRPVIYQPRRCLEVGGLCRGGRRRLLGSVRPRPRYPVDVHDRSPSARLRHLRLAGSLLRLVTGLPLLKRPHVAVGVTEI